MGTSVRTLLVSALAILAVAGVSFAADFTVRGRITDPEGLPLPGVTVTLTGPDGRVQTAVTDGTGAYAIAAPAGSYHLKAQLDGFQPAERSVDLRAADVAMDLTLALAAHQEEVIVKGDQPQPVIGQPHPDAPATVTREVVDNGMLPNSQYDDVLPLLPNVVRGPDGLISVAGARAQQGALFVNGFDQTDPVSGQPGLILPLEAVDSLDVFSGGYSAELGHATGGVTVAHTRPGADAFHSSFSSFFPRMRFRNGTVEGVDFWEPNAGASGAIVKDRLFYEEAVSYRFDRNKFGTLAGTEDQKFNEVSSWTQFDLQVSPGQHLVTSFSFNPQTTDHANITAFTPSSTVPRLDRGSFTAGFEDRLTLGNAGTLAVGANLIRTASTLEPQGSQPYEVGHDLAQGSYFDRQDLHGARLQTSGVYSRTVHENHLVRVGANLGRADLSGSDVASPVEMLRSDGTPAQLITFLPSLPLAASVNELGAFVQDTWTPAAFLTFDAGIRYDATSGLGHTVSPRSAWTVKLPDGRSTIGGSVGFYGDKLPLEAMVFPALQARTVQAFDATGTVLGPPRLFVNEIAGPLTMPVAFRWDLEYDRHLSGSWLARIKYQERRGSHEPVVDPIVLSDTSGLLALQSTGISRSRSVETTVAWRGARSGDEVYLSYVHSQSTGNLNSFDVIEGVMKEPFVQEDAVGPLAADVPNRLLAWGVLHLPFDITFAPFVEIRSGFPYSAIEDDWIRVGLPNGYRFPWFGSLDVYVNKVIRVSNRLPAARIGLKVYSLASVHSERDVQRDIARPDFGTTYNAIPRDYAGVFEILWGNR